MNTTSAKRKWEKLVKDIEERTSFYKRKPLFSFYKPQLSKPLQPSSVWKLFYRQTQAFNFARTCKEDVHVFALEKSDGNNQRLYLVTTYTEFWFYYSKRGTNLMHCYEVIPETAVCKLYFDLEFYIPTNQGANAKQMIAELIKFVCRKLDEYYGVKCSPENILKLDSSTEAKYSCHLIFLLEDAAFKNNVHIGNFLRTILKPAILLTKNKDTVDPDKAAADLSPLPENQESQLTCQDTTPEKGISQWKENPDLSFLVVNGKQEVKQLFVDLGVYTKNRNFRLYKSSKAGHSAVLDIGEDNKFVPKSVKNSCIDEQYFLSSLICNVRFSDSLTILTCGNQEDLRKKSVCFEGNISKSSLDSIGGCLCSPYPEIDDFVRSLINKDNVQGGIRRWNYFSLEQLLVYDISHYRWCRNIGRAHKSNHIMIVIDLKNEIWYQKCHDPLCKAENFKSECFPLPAEVCLPSLFSEDVDYVNAVDENGNTEEKANTADFTGDGTPFTAIQQNSQQNKAGPDAEWDDELDTCLLAASEDVELIEAIDNFHPQRNSTVDELLVDALRGKRNQGLLDLSTDHVDELNILFNTGIPGSI